MLNMKKLMTKLLVAKAKIPMVTWKSALVSNNYKVSSTAWSYCNLSFTVPVGHIYLASGYAGWSSGKPVGVGIHTASTLGNEGYPRYSVYDANGMMQTPYYVLPNGTYYLFEKRATVPSANNYHAIFVLDLDFT